MDDGTPIPAPVSYDVYSGPTIQTIVYRATTDATEIDVGAAGIQAGDYTYVMGWYMEGNYKVKSKVSEVVKFVDFRDKVKVRLLIELVPAP